MTTRSATRRILLIAPTSFFADYGCHVRILGQAVHLARRGHQLLLCTYHSGRDIAGLDIRRTPHLPWRRGAEVGSSWHKLALDLFLLALALRTAVRWRPHVCHAFLHEGALIGAIVGRLLRVPLVFDFQGSLTSEMIDHRFLRAGSPAHGPLRRLEGWIDRQPAVILANSGQSADLLSGPFSVPRDRLIVVPDCVDAERFRPATAASQLSVEERKATLGLPADALIIVYLGLLATYQGIELLLQALQKLPAAPPMHALIMGFPHVEHYRRLVAEMGLEGRVTFTGAIPYESAHHYLALGDIAVGPKISATEGSGKLLNYMAMGLPSVAFDTPVSREYLGEAGLLVPLGDVDAFAAAVTHLAEQPAERADRGRRLRARAIELFGWSTATERIESAYALACDRRSRML